MDAYLGQIRIFAGTYAPQGWAICDGSTLPIVGNEALYGLIGTTYGGDAQSNFKLPDLRGRLPIHVGQGDKMITNYAQGQTVGVETVTITDSTMPAHTHRVNATTVGANQTSPTNNLLGTTAKGFYELATAPGFTTVALNSVAVQPTGGGMFHDNNMPTIALNYIICLSGLYPDFQ